MHFYSHVLAATFRKRNVFPVQCWWISIISFDGVAVDFVAGVGFRLFPCGFRLLGGGFRGFG